MPRVKWWIANKKEAAKLGKRSRFIETDLRDILLNWDEDTTMAKKTDVKFIKVTYGRVNFIEFRLYSSEEYTRALNKMYQNMPILYDKYQLVLVYANLKRKEGRRWLESKTALNAFKKIKNINKRKPDYKNWVDLDTLNETMIEIDELMSKLEEYEIMDILTK